MTQQVSIGVWNVNWANRRGQSGRFFARRLSELDCDVLCVTEGCLDLLPAGGQVISSDADYGYPITPGRRKVLLWSRVPWRSIDAIGSPALPTGRFVSGITQTPLGDVRFIGVCIPWRDAHVRTGKRNRRPWEDHLSYLKHLRSTLTGSDAALNILLGDFNQRVPRASQPPEVFSALCDVLSNDFRLLTAGSIPGATTPSIDHLAVKGPLQAERIEYLSPIALDGRLMSDHYGLRVMLRMC